MMKVSIILILSLFVFRLSASGQTEPADTLLTIDEINWLDSNRVNIRYAPNASWGVAEYVDENGVPHGIIQDYIQIFEKKLGVTFKNVYFNSWNDLLNGLKNSKADFVGAIQKTPEREKYLNFTDPYLDIPVLILVRKNFPDELTEHYLETMKLAGVKGYSSTDYIKKKYPTVKIIECDDDLSALLQTSMGNTTGTISDLLSASYLIEKYGINNLSMGMQLNYTWHLSFACRKDVPELCSILNKVLKTIPEKERQAIYNKWVNVDTIPSQDFLEKNVKLILIISGFLLIGALIIFSNNALLKRLVRSKTEELKNELEEKEKAVAESRKNESKLESLFEIYKYQDERVEGLLDYALGEAVKLTGSQFAALYMVEQNATTFILSNYCFNPDKDPVNSTFKPRLERDDCNICFDIIKDKDITVNNTPLHFEIFEGENTPVILKNSACVPIKEEDNNEVSAIFLVANKGSDYDQADARQLILLINSAWKLFNRHKLEMQLKMSKEKAEESDSLKTAFLQNMSHEVRTPLNAIVGFSQMITDPGQSANLLEEYSKMIKKSSDKLIDIISNVIEMSQIHVRQGQLVSVEFDIVQLISDLVKKFEESAKHKNLNLVFHNDLPGEKLIILSDREKLRKIYYHLIDNAVKFTNKGTVEITSELKQEILRVTISDTGIGIPEKTRKIIFEPFRQLDSHLTRSYGGNGLGLPLADAYVKMLNGSLALTSEENKGTTVQVDIPVSLSHKKSLIKEKDEVIPSPDQGKKKSSDKTVLIAEDDYSNYIYLVELLKSYKLNILHAINGQQAAELCKNDRKVALILMDIMMPVMDGYEAAKQIKSFSHVPIIAQTAYAMEDEVSKYSTVFDDYLTKPIGKEEVIRIIEKYLFSVNPDNIA